jgi:fumarate hydratase subunit alpha
LGLLDRKTLLRAVSTTITRAATTIPKDIREAFGDALSAEKDEIARSHIKTTLENVNVATRKGSLVCSDTGFPLFYVKLGDCVELEGKYRTLSEVFVEAVEKATLEGALRATMVHPLTRFNPGTNVGGYLPYVEYKLTSADYIELTTVLKGGGSELFLAVPYRTLLLADGLQGFKKFVIDSTISATLDGKTCPPNIVGLCLGGFPDLCIKLAKQAAVLRPIGDRHPDKEIAELEMQLLNAINATEIGPMGCSGRTTAFDVHMECAHTHTLAMPVAVSLQCSICRRATVRIYSNGEIEKRSFPQWFER